MSTHYNELQEFSKSKLILQMKSLKDAINSDINYVEQASEMIFDELINDLSFEIVSEYHRAIVKGYVDEIYPRRSEESCDNGTPTEFHSNNELVEKKVEDIIKCPNCTHSINVSLFARHLENCMGIGRSSTRTASRRMATNSKESNYAAVSDDDDDEYWNSGSKRNNKIIKKIDNKKKKDATKKSKNVKEFKNGKSVDKNKMCKVDNRYKEESVDWHTSPKMQLSPLSTNRVKKSGHDLDTETEDTSTTPSPADSNSTSSGSLSRRRDRVKPKRKAKNGRYSDEQLHR